MGAEELGSTLQRMKTFSVRHRVAFSETDMAGIVHFSNFFRFMELAEDAFFRELGGVLIDRREGEVLGWPRVRASCDYKAPLCFGEEVEIVLRVLALKVRAIEFGFGFFRWTDGEGRGERVARGRMTTVQVRRRTGEGMAEMEPFAIDDELLARLREWCPEEEVGPAAGVAGDRDS